MRTPNDRISLAVPPRFVFGPMEFRDAKRTRIKSMRAAEAKSSFPKTRKRDAQKPTGQKNDAFVGVKNNTENARKT